MNQGLAINDKLCSCSHGGGDDCTVVILTTPKSEPFQVQRVSADGAPRQAPRRWNLSLFGGPDRPDLHLHRGRSATVEQINCLRVVLTFATTERRREFERQLRVSLGEYRAARVE